MQFLHENHDKRIHPETLVQNTQSIICVRLDYLVVSPTRQKATHQNKAHKNKAHKNIARKNRLKNAIADNAKPNHAIIARYARGRDYHKTMRGLLKQLAKRIECHLKENHMDDDFTWRPFADSAPIFEKTLAENAGLGWTGKNTLLINKQAGSFFVLGELFTSLALPFDKPHQHQAKQAQISTHTLADPMTLKEEYQSNEPSIHCGSCTACIDICPTQAIVAPYQLDARRCIAYQTIENKHSIPTELRPLIGNRVFGCDDCQLICPWNRFAKTTTLKDFMPRNQLDDITLLALWQWDEATFLKNTEGSPIRRTGYQSFMRNIAIAMGNAPYAADMVSALTTHTKPLTPVVQEHIDWAIRQQLQRI